MDYEKAYKDLFNVTKELFPNMTEYQKEKYQGICPELRLSEDEKVKKEILRFLINFNNGCYTKPKETDIVDWIFWIEKQESVEWSEEDSEMLQRIISYCEQKYILLPNEVDWLKSLKPQPKQEWSDEDNEIIISIIKFLKTLSSRRDGVTFTSEDFDSVILNKWANWLQSLKHQRNWKPSEKQMKVLGEMFHRGNTRILESLYEDLEKL